MISYLGSLVQFSPAAGRAGRCRQKSLCVGSTRRVPATLGLPRTGVSVLSPSTLLRLPAALDGAGPAVSAVPVFGSSTKARIRLCLRVVSSPPQRFRQPEVWRSLPGRGVPFPSTASGLGSQRLGRPLPRCGAPFPSAAQRAPRSGLRKSLDRNRGLFARWVGVASLGLSLPLAPPPASFLQRGWVGSSLEFLSPFVLLMG